MDLSGANTVELAHVKYEDISLVDNNVELENDNETLETEEEMIDEDKKQQMKVLSLFVVEFYKILTGCLLLIFVPQKCGDHNCTINDIVTMDDMTYQANLYFNLFSFVTFFSLYGVELHRENTLIKYLDINIHKPRDNDSVGMAIEGLKKRDLNKIRYNRKLYDNMGKFCSLLFIINSILSGMSLYNRQLDTKTMTVYLTNVLFTGTKLLNIRSVVYTKPNIFYSAYMTRRVQYNDIDSDVYDFKEEKKEQEIENMEQEQEVEEFKTDENV